MEIFWFVVYVLAVMRVTRLINFDTIMDWLHIGVGNKVGPDHWLPDFLTCPWCVGMWAALLSAWFPILLLGWSWWWYLPVALAASMVVGLMARFSNEKTALEPE